MPLVAQISERAEGAIYTVVISAAVAGVIKIILVVADQWRKGRGQKHQMAREERKDEHQMTRDVRHDLDETWKELCDRQERQIDDQREQIKELRAEVADLRKENDRLMRRNAVLEPQANVSPGKVSPS